MPTFSEVMRDKRLLKPFFNDVTSWSAWETLSKASNGLALNEQELALYRECTRRHQAPTGPFRELVAIVGRRGGKTSWGTAMVTLKAIGFDPKILAPGERAVVQIVAGDRDQARVAFNYVRGVLGSSPTLKTMIVKQTADRIELANRVDIEVATCSFRSIRGRTCLAAYLDEVAYWLQDGLNPAVEVRRAILPSLATLPDAILIETSSPYARSGLLYDLHQQYYGKEHREVVVWQAASRVMNPKLSEHFIAAEKAKDPAAGRSEWDAQFRDDLESLFTTDVVQRAVVRGRHELPPDREISYVAFCDPSGGRADRFTVAIGHDRGSKFAIDCLRWFDPPFDPASVVAEICQILLRYGLESVVGDNYAGEWVAGEFARHGVDYIRSKRVKAECYLIGEAYLNMSKVELPDCELLTNELKSLERRVGKSGKDAIDHPRGGHDDVANVVCGVVALLADDQDDGPRISYPLDDIPSIRGPAILHNIRERVGDAWHRPGGINPFGGGEEDQ